MHVLLVKGGLDKAIGPVATIAALFSAMIHDFEHQGVTNEFLVRYVCIYISTSVSLCMWFFYLFLCRERGR